MSEHQIINLVLLTVLGLHIKWLRLTLQEGGGLLMPALNKSRIFGTFLWSKWPKKIWLFPNIYDNASHTLLGAWNGEKRGFYSIFVSRVKKSTLKHIIKCMVLYKSVWCYIKVYGAIMLCGISKCRMCNVWLVTVTVPPGSSDCDCATWQSW